MSIRSWVKVVLVTIVTGLHASCMCSVNHPAGSTMIDRLQDESVALVMVSEDPSSLVPGAHKVRAYCSAVWVSDDQILTAEHCVEDLGQDPLQSALKELGIPVAPWDPTGQRLTYAIKDDVTQDGMHFSTYRNAVVAVDDKTNDLALLRVEPDTAPHRHNVATVAPRDVRTGDELSVIGNPKGFLWTYMVGRVSAQRTVNNFNGASVNVTQVSAPIWYGNSGGGAFNSDGDLVGICSFMGPIPNAGFFVHRTDIASFLKRYNVKV